ncbi:MAG TPA: hypothetical protein DCR12_06115 [Lachnospiraceae bacterium]|nr:hypothetical protein [Lachnospiraceae bacterium]
MEGFLSSNVVIIVFDVLILLLGLYLIFNAIKMKKTDEMPSILLTPKELKLCKNPYGFIDYMFPFLLIFGIVATVFGIVSLLGDTVLNFPRIYDGIAVVILLAVWFWFSMMLRKAKQKFM